MTAATAGPSHRFVFDENLSVQLARAIRLLDDDALVDHITDLFPAGTGDPEFLPMLGKEGRLLVTRDARQRKRPAELDAWKRNGVGSFVLGGKNLGAWDIVTQVVLAWPKMKEAAANTQRPFAYRVRQGAGRLEPLSL